jgi:hypothetical protein
MVKCPDRRTDVATGEGNIASSLLLEVFIHAGRQPALPHLNFQGCTQKLNGLLHTATMLGEEQ